MYFLLVTHEGSTSQYAMALYITEFLSALVLGKVSLVGIKPALAPQERDQLLRRVTLNMRFLQREFMCLNSICNTMYEFRKSPTAQRCSGGSLDRNPFESN